MTVQLDRCELSCSVDQGGVQPVQAAFSPLPAVEVTARVQFVHQETLWIAEGIISDAKGIEFAVPYPGQWEVFLISEPEFVTAGAINTTNSNLSQLKANLANYVACSWGFLPSNQSK